MPNRVSGSPSAMHNWWKDLSDKRLQRFLGQEKEGGREGLIARVRVQFLSSTPKVFRDKNVEPGDDNAAAGQVFNLSRSLEKTG